jgi:hypothetical protein
MVQTDAFPDLVIERITVMGGSVQVEVKNQGTKAVQDAFRVDLYVDPNPVPTEVNQTWQTLGSEGGIVWVVTEPALPLGRGQKIVLTIGDDYYRPDHSNFPSSLSPDTPIYAQVDSFNVDTLYGEIMESHEILLSFGYYPYNNIAGPVYPSSVFPEPEQ